MVWEDMIHCCTPPPAAKHKLTHDHAAVVAPAIKWLPIDANTPIGSKMMLIDQAQGVAYLRIHLKGDGFTHWHPLPTF
jgi:hypothetical protein